MADISEADTSWTLKGWQVVVDKIDTNMSGVALWAIAVVVAVIGIIVLISGSALWGIILLIAAALIGPGGYSIFRRRA